MKLILCEKPDVARKFARALKCHNSEIFDVPANDEYIVATAAGHLLETNYDAMESDKWELSILPQLWDDMVDTTPKSKFHRNLLFKIKQILNSDLITIDEVIVATDAGREGSLIARRILDFCNWRGKTSRFWVSESLSTNKVILDGLNNLKYDSYYNEYLSLASYIRSLADFTVGMNLTRAMTLKRSGPGTVYSIGRVMTPTLSEVYRREQERENFIPETYYSLEVTLLVNGVEIKRVINQRFDKTFDIGTLKLENIKYTTELNKPKYGAPLFSLVSLQKHMNGKFNVKLDTVSSVADKLYQEGVLSYPRTESEYLGEDISGKMKYVYYLREIINRAFNDTLDEEKFKNTVLSKGKLLFNNDKLTDHHALMISNVELLFKSGYINSNSIEGSITREVIKRQICRSAEPLLLDVTDVDMDINIDGNVFKLNDLKFIKSHDGYSKYYPEVIGENDKYPDLVNTELDIKLSNYQFIEKQTEPPTDYTLPTLLEWMEKNNIGTSITKEATLTKLLNNGMMYLIGKYAHVTDFGTDLIRQLNNSIITSAEFTSKMEMMLEDIRKTGDDSLVRKMIKDFTSESVNYIKSNVSKKEILVKCPKCNNDLNISDIYSKCSCGFVASRRLLGSYISVPDYEKLLKGEYIYQKDMKTKSGKKMSCYLRFSKDFSDLQFIFDKNDERLK